MKKKETLGNWEPKKKRNFEPNELRDSNKTLWIVLGGGLTLILILIISFFTAAHFFPSFFFFGSEDTAAVMKGEEIKLDEFQYYLTLAAENARQAGKDPSYWEDAKREKQLKQRALDLLQADRMYPKIAESLSLTLTGEQLQERDRQLEDLQNRQDTPLLQFQLKSRAITLPVWRQTILAESYKKALEAYFISTADPADVEQTARQLYAKSYLKLHFIRISLTDSSGNPLPEAEQEQLRTKGYGIYQKLQQGEPFPALQKQLANEEQFQIYDQLITRGQLDKTAEEAAFSLEENEISELIETEQALYLMQRINGEEDFADQEVAMVYLARQKLFSEWIDSYRSKYPIKPYRSNIKKFDAVSFLSDFYQQKEEADQQIDWMKKSQ